MLTRLAVPWRSPAMAASTALLPFLARAATMTPVAVTGFNWDAVVENTASGPPYTSFASELNPGENLSFYQSGLPVTRSLTSAVEDGTVFQFQPYTSNNALVLGSDTALSSGTLKLATPAVYGRVAIVANSASAASSSAGSLTLTFSDGRLMSPAIVRRTGSSSASGCKTKILR